MSEDVVAVPVQELLQCLIDCSEKAACIARTFRREEDIFGLLVEEKCNKKINLKVIQDFKTLADVIVQESIKHDVGKKFPVLSSKIFGEEQNVFQNTIGEQIKVELTDSLQETTNLLVKVLDGRIGIAQSLAKIIHSVNNTAIDYASSAVIPINNLGIWIDPIDSTAEYIQPNQKQCETYGFDLTGLKCVSVLIGVYDLDTGFPVMGIINQPFFKECCKNDRWESNIYWGVCYKDEVKTSQTLLSDTQRQNVIVTSRFESEELLSIMKTKYSILQPAGSGYKSLLVAMQLANLYVLSFDSTHLWDTCGPHAILSALGGGMVSFRTVVNSPEVIDHSNIHNFQQKYSDLSDDSFKNLGGLIAYRNEKDLFEFLKFLREASYVSSQPN